MRTTVRKWFWGWDFDKEEAWLNEMAAKGLALVSVGLGRYEFEETEPGEYRVAMELLEHLPTHPESRKYFEFLESTGAEQAGSFWRWCYYRKKASEGSFELFSDYESRVKHLVRILWVVAIVAGLNFYAGVYTMWLFYAFRSPLNLMGIVSFFLCGLLAYGMWKLWKKIKRLRDDAQIYES